MTKQSIFTKLSQYHNIIYITHMLIVAPLLFVVAYYGLKDFKKSKYTVNSYHSLLILQGSLAIMVFFYHSYKLYISMI